MGLSPPFVFIVRLLSISPNYVHEEQLRSQFKLSTQHFYRGTENLKTVVLGFWVESGKGIQEKINQPEQPGAFARVVVSVVCDLFWAA